MVYKKILLLLITFINFSLFPIFATEENQNLSDSNLQPEEEAFEEESAEEEFSVEEKWQILEWYEENSEFVSYYEVLIEKYDEKSETYTEINKLKTEDNSTSIKVEPQLQPGMYRFKVITYDLIGFGTVESDWETFSIYKAYRPQINDISSKVNGSSTLYLEEINDGIFSVSGKNLFETSKNEKDIQFTKYFVVNQNDKKQNILVPEILNVENNNRKIEFQLNMKDLDVGVYDFVAEDASGLKSESNNNSIFTVKFKKKVDFDLSAGYVLPVILFDDTINHYMGSNLWPLSGTFRMSFMPFKRSFGYFGVGLAGTYSRLFAEFPQYKIDGNLITAHLNFVYQLPIRFRIKNSEQRRHALTLEVHGGVGATFFNDVRFHFPHDINSKPLNSINLSFDVGGAVQVYITSRLYAEVGVDFVMAFMSDMQFGVLHPSVCIGWQF